ncbi:MAG: DUF6036 family nucleotidyltransferase [Anaeroplasmataceae bacterium]
MDRLNKFQNVEAKSLDNSKAIDRTLLYRLFEEINEGLIENGIHLDLCIYGGSLMTLLYSQRISTMDIDCVFNTDDSIVLELILKNIGSKYNLRRDWFNSEVKLPLETLSKEEKISYKTLSNLNINVCSKEQLLAMKIVASRAEPSHDFNDCVLLCKDLEIEDLKDLKSVISEFISFDILKMRHLRFIKELGLELGGDWSWR